MNLYLISGGSRGLGAALIKRLSADHRVLDLSRGSIEWPMDLNHLEEIPVFLNKIFSSLQLEQYAEAILINNAGIVLPIGPVGSLRTEQIVQNININLSAAIVLCNSFLQHTEKYVGKRSIVNISSGVVQRPKESWSCYSAAKSGLHAFSLALEKELGDSCSILSYNPGVMDTKMQEEIRAVDPRIFPESERFHRLKKEGQLIDPMNAANDLLRELERKRNT